MSKSAPIPHNENERLAALRALGVLDAPREALFDSLACTAAALCDAPVALVTLVDERRQWFVSSFGMDDERERDRDTSFCAHVVAEDDLVEVPDATQDERFADNPFVTGPDHIRFYCGAPIRANGMTLGSLCVVDQQPRRLADHQRLALTHLAGVAARGLESRATAAQAVAIAEQIATDLARGRELLQITLHSIGDAVITTDPDGLVQWMNPVAERLTCWPTGEAVGQPVSRVFRLVDDASRAEAPNPAELCLGRIAAVEGLEQTTLIARDGSEFAVESSAATIREPDATVLGAVLTFRDVSEQRRLNSEMSHRATHDFLTGLPNRTAFEARIANLLATGTTLAGHALLYLDLDQFKVVNDACGHSAGDQLLREICGIVRACVRGQDMLARLGGDEFGLLLEHCDPEHALAVGQKICDQMDHFRFVYEGRRFRVGASIGLVPLDARWPNVKALFQAAEASCYAAKEEGRNRVHVWRDSDTAVEARRGDMQWVSRIELALDEDRFALYGQRIAPITGVRRGLHFEVLLRMSEEGGPPIAPGAFLPVAERFHLATRIDRWVVRKSFEWMSRAERSGVDIELMSVNLSGQSLGDRAFHRDMVEFLQAAHFDVSRLCFEITETAAITHLSEARSFIEDVRALGVKIALDDFGAGASSFGYLKSLPVDFLKIDGHFVTNLLEDEIDNAAVRCFCEVARAMGVQTIAEFVEHEAVRRELRAIGIDMAQGYLVHKPEPLQDLFAAASRSGHALLDDEDAIRVSAVREIAVDVPNPNRLDLENPADVLLWADDLGVPEELLREIVAKVGPMRAAIRYYVASMALA